MGIPLNYQLVSNSKSKSVETKTSSVPTKTNVGNKALKIGVGALALMGTLGVADVLLCKGKHINKLTGQGKRLEAAISQATQSEARAVAAEARAATAEAKIVTAERDVVKASKRVAACESQISMLEAELKKGGNLAKDYPNILKWLQVLYSDALLEFPQKQRDFVLKKIEDILYSSYYDLAADATKLTDPKYLKFFVQNYNSNITKPMMCAPAFIDCRTGKVALPGIVTLPEIKPKIV